MRKTLFATLVRTVVIGTLAASSGCSSAGSGSDGPSLYGSWIYEDDSGTQGIGMTLKEDGTYVGVDLVLTSTSSANAEVETGTFTASGGTLTFTPEQWSCKGPDPATSLQYSFRGSNLVLTQPSGVVSLRPNDSSSSDSFALAIGCFDRKTGAFSRSPLAPVTN